MSLFKKLLAIFGFGIVKPTKWDQIRFFKDAGMMPRHGMIVVNSPTYGLKQRAVAFSFGPMDFPPDLTLDVLQKIWNDAIEQGFQPLHIDAYLSVSVESTSEMIRTPNNARNDLYADKPKPSTPAFETPRALTDDELINGLTAQELAEGDYEVFAGNALPVGFKFGASNVKVDALMRPAKSAPAETLAALAKAAQPS